MDITYIIGQIFGIIGLVITAASYQAKTNRKLFICQALGGLSFAINFLLIGDISAGIFNLANLVRGMIFSKSKKRVWELTIVEVLYIVCFVFSMTKIWGIWIDVALSVLTFASLVVMSVVMWLANPKHMRYTQFFFVSPAWLTNNIFHFTLGGILCEVLTMSSVVISFIRYGKDGFEN